MAELMDLPEEVVESWILPNLQWNDLLRCRRVCKTLKNITDTYVRVHPDRAPFIEVHDTNEDKSITAFLSLGIPTTKLFINNITGDQFYSRNTADLTLLLERYGTIIKSLRLNQLSMYTSFEEWDFLEALTNLKRLEAGYLGFGVASFQNDEDLALLSRRKLSLAKQDPRFGPNFMPLQILQSLEIIKIGQNQGYLIANINNNIADILTEAQHLKHFEFPFSSKHSTTVLGLHAYLTRSIATEFTRHHDVLANVFKKLSNTIDQRGNLGGGKEHQNLEHIDFANYHGELGEGIADMHWAGSPPFLELCLKCISHGVRLLNVCPIWFFQRVMIPGFESPDLGKCVVSMVNLHHCVFPMNMVNLVRLNIRETSRCCVNGNWREERTEWPALKRIDIGVDSVSVQCSEDPEHMQGTELLFKFLWREVRRETMTEINLAFARRCDSCEGCEKHVGARLVAVPKLDDIGRSCPNLKKIGLQNWPGTNIALVKLWRELSGSLEEVVMGYCEGLGNVAFVGEDKEKPVFLEMRRLKKFSLVGLHKMPKITDTLFKGVLARIKLSQLLLHSDKPVEKVTKFGIQALLQGPFAETIEKFPFDGWSIANVTSEEFQQLGKQFRSYDML